MARILVCEDDPVFQELVKSALAKDGHEVTCVGDGSEAISALARESFELMVTDIVMPGKDGLETIRELRFNRSDLPVLAMTSGLPNLKAEFLKAASALGADSVIKKPFKASELRERVTSLLSKGSTWTQGSP